MLLGIMDPGARRAGGAEGTTGGERVQRT